jgi:hypothetical protein
MQEMIKDEETGEVYYNVVNEASNFGGCRFAFQIDADNVLTVNAYKNNPIARVQFFKKKDYDKRQLELKEKRRLERELKK